LALSTLTKKHEERIRLVQEERQQAWKEKRQEVELFPNLQGNTAVGASSSMYPAGSSKGHEYNHFYERRRAMDVAMGRRVEDDGQRKSRVLRIESKPAKGKGTAKKKKKKQNDEQKSQSALSQIKQEENVVVDSDNDEEVAEVEIEEEPWWDYDGDELVHGVGEGPLADAEDDGFARHATSFPPEPLLIEPATSGWWEQIGISAPLRYIAKSNRTRCQQDDDEEQGDAVPRLVPGAAPKEERGDGVKSTGKKGGRR
jgi:hypothetical protein